MVTNLLHAGMLAIVSGNVLASGPSAESEFNWNRFPDVPDGSVHWITVEDDSRNSARLGGSLLGVDHLISNGMAFNLRMHSAVSFHDIANEPHYFLETEDSLGAQMAVEALRISRASYGAFQFVTGGELTNSIALMSVPFKEEGDSVTVHQYHHWLDSSSTHTLELAQDFLHPARAQTWISFERIDEAPIVNVATDESEPQGWEPGDLSLRKALALASPGATITFAPEMDGQTIALDGQALNLSRDVTIDASSLANGLTIDAGYASGVVHIASGVHVTLTGLHLTRGETNKGAGVFVSAAASLKMEESVISDCHASFFGGGVSSSGATIVIETSSIRDCSARYGGGIRNGGNMTLDRVTVSGCRANHYGGAINNVSSDAHLAVHCSTFDGNIAQGAGGGAINNKSNATADFFHCTISGNAAPNGASGGIRTTGGQVTIQNCIVAGNEAASEPQLGSSVVEWLLNITSGDPMLAPLGNYGGPTETRPPLAGSPVISNGFLYWNPNDYPGSPEIEFIDQIGNVLVLANDAWEWVDAGAVQYTLDFDSDGDGLTDGEEAILGSDPLLPEAEGN